MTSLHRLLALLCGLAIVLVGAEAAFRAWRGTAPSAMSNRLINLSLIALGVTAASGLGILAGGARPHEWWHLMYGGLAFVTLPLAGSFTARAKSRRRALVTLGSALFVLAVIVRLFATG